MSWDESRGLVGSVEWGTEARRQIKAGEYKYLSPHFRIDRESRRVDHVLAVALTNTPRINNMRELVAASVAAVTVKPSDGGNTMLKKNRVKLCSVLELKDEATDEEIIAQVEEAVEAPSEELPAEDQAVIAVKGLLMEIQRALMEANVIGADASLSDAMQAALDLIGRTAEEGAEEAAASIATALGMKGKPTTEEMVATIHEHIAKTVPVTELEKVQEQVASLTAERIDRQATEIVGTLIEDGKINPHDEKNMTWARNLAKSNPDQLASLMENAPALYKSDRQTPDSDAIKTKRDTVIASAIEDFKTDACGASKKFYVNAALDEDGLEHLNEEEIKKHAIA
jgi:phage I-like protein